MPMAEPNVPETSSPESKNESGGKGDGNESKTSKPATLEKKGGSVSAGDANAPGDAAATILTYRELDDIVTRPAEQLCPPGDARLILASTDWNVFSQITGYQAFLAGLDELFVRCDTVVPAAKVTRESVVAPAITKEIEAITGLFKATSDLLALFKAEVSTTAKEVNVDEDALIASVIRGVSAEHSNLRILYRPWLRTSGNAIGERLTHLDAKRATITAEHDRLDGEEHKDRRARLKEVLQLIDGFKAALIEGGQGRLADLYAAQALSEVLTKEGAYVLFVKSIYGGGERLEIARTFFHRAEIYESGGTVVTYMLASPEGAVLSSGNLESHSGYVRHTDMRAPS